MSPISASQYEELAFLLENARLARAAGAGDYAHLDQLIGIWSYIRIADQIAQEHRGGRLLDWGCGYGQMTYLLRRRGFTVVPFDIGASRQWAHLLPLGRLVQPVRTDLPTDLPFKEASFDLILSCGVLEHVDEYSGPGHEEPALNELARLLRPGGRLLIYQLPQRDAWQEALIRRFKLGYSHPRRYTAETATDLLLRCGFRPLRLRRANFIPRNLTGMPQSLRAVYSRLSRPLIAIDTILSNLPLLRRIAGVMELVAEVADRATAATAKKE